MKHLTLLVLLTFSGLALGQASSMGNGSTGGGNIFGDRLNPWFLKNTSRVEYCVEIAPEFSRLSRPRVLAVIADAFHFWKETFRKYDSSNFQHDFELDSPLGTQEFLYQEHCHEKTDIKFQLGFLTPDQLKRYPNHRQLIGMAERTHYDPAALKGRGFIYIAPEEGKLRPLSPKLHATPWSFGRNRSLKFALVHELGHVFGLQDDHYSFADLMSAKFVELITGKDAVRAAERHGELNLPAVFGCSREFEGELRGEYSSVSVPSTEGLKGQQTPAEKLRQLLNLPKRFSYHYKGGSGVGVLKVQGKEFGRVELKTYNGAVSAQIAPAITLYLTKKQQVFPNLPRKAYNVHLDIYHVNSTVLRKGEVLKLANGKELNVFINFDRQCVPQFGTVIDGEVFMDIFVGI